MKASLLTRTLLISAVDLTRACAAQEHYCEWLASYSDAVGGSAGVAHYLASAAFALAEASHFPIAARAAFAAHETLSDILMTSPPLSAAQLQEAVRTALRDGQEDDTTLPFSLVRQASTAKR